MFLKITFLFFQH